MAHIQPSSRTIFIECDPNTHNPCQAAHCLQTSSMQLLHTCSHTLHCQANPGNSPVPIKLCAIGPQAAALAHAHLKQRLLQNHTLTFEEALPVLPLAQYTFV